MNELPKVEESLATEMAPEDPRIGCTQKFTTSFETHAIQNSKETMKPQKFSSLKIDDLNLNESIPESFGKDLTDFNLSLSMTGKQMLLVTPPNEDVLVETFGKVDRKLEH